MSLAITTVSVPQGFVGRSYLQGITVTGGSGVYVPSITAGALPTGLVAAMGSPPVNISGTPTVRGVFTFTLHVYDYNNPSLAANANLFIVIQDGHLIRKSSNGKLERKANGHLINGLANPNSPTITTTALNVAMPGVAYSFTMAATGGTGPYTWSILSGALPTGLTLSSAGVISGTSTAVSGPYNVTIKVTDSAGMTSSSSFVLTVLALTNLSFTLTFNQGTTSNFLVLQVYDPAKYVYVYNNGYWCDPYRITPYNWTEYDALSYGWSLVSANGGTIPNYSLYGTITQVASWAGGASPSGIFKFWIYGSNQGHLGDGSQAYTLTIKSGSTVIWTHSATQGTQPSQDGTLWTFDSTTGVVS